MSAQTAASLIRLAVLVAAVSASPSETGLREEEVLIPAHEGRVLAGTLTLPGAGGPSCPVALTLTGSGAHFRDGNRTPEHPYRPFRQIAAALAVRGVATLRLDDRGVGGSTGDANAATGDDTADDARVALAWLRERAGIDPGRIALIGHSFGGEVAPLVAAADPRVAALVLMGAPAQNFRETMRYQHAYRIDNDPAVAPDRRGAALAEAMRRQEEFVAASVEKWRQWSQDRDPLPNIRAVRCPVLILHGFTDRAVPPGDARLLEQALLASGNTAVTVRMFDVLNHHFQHDPVGAREGYDRLPTQDLDPEFLETLAAWLSRTLGASAARPATAETGYDLWLRYERVHEEAALRKYTQAIREIVIQGRSAPERAARDELRRGLRGLLGEEIAVSDAVGRTGTLLAGTPSGSPAIASLGWAGSFARLGKEGYLIRSAKVGGLDATVIASDGDVGVLYGAFHFLRLIQTRQPVERLDIAQRPRLDRRLLDHWDNIDGSIERGYAGASLWSWDELPRRVEPRVTDYGRANASIGVNGAVLNNVNANADFLRTAFLEKAAALADALRPYGVRVYLSANLAAPRLLGGASTADPLDPAVARWWREKADEIYRLIPDFGGFLVKANSEGQPGPQDYGRTHADGANVLADALRPHGGVVLWRAFVYDASVDPDRVKRAYVEFVPLDGKFRDNVLVQIKNGPLDFQPREPFHPLFGALPHTPLVAEVQITQEYLGQSTHLVYLAPLWKEFLDADTGAKGPGSPVAKLIDGTLEGHHGTGIAGVANTGRDVNWCGHDFAQANWYAYGRLAWDPALGAEAIAEEWARMTWGQEPRLVETIRSMLLDSREAYVDYTMPLGLHHLIGGDHYAPMPENADPRRADWSAVYYHRADAAGIGFDRTRGGSGAVDQYRAPLRDQWNDPATTPETLLLWFHHLPWDHRLASGSTLWDALVLHYNRGAARAARLEEQWKSLRGSVDAERFDAVLAKLGRQTADAAAWRDKCLAYFQRFSRRPIATR